MNSFYKRLRWIEIKFGSLLERLNFLIPNEEFYLRLLFRLKLGKHLNLSNPQSFNEKLQWLKLYYRKIEFTQMVDKYEVKNYVKNLLDEKYIIPTIGVWEKPEDIEWDNLPNQFVLKTTHGGGGVGVVVCKNKQEFDKTAAIAKLNRSLNISGYNYLKEWPYKHIHKRIIAEKYMEDLGMHQLVDYKFLCFNGEPKLVLVCKDRFESSGLTKDFYTPNWEQINLKRSTNGNSNSAIEKPLLLSEMLDVAKTLSKGLPFIRIDLYLVNQQIYFGEFTFFPASGLSAFEPDEWDAILGSWITLPKN